MYSRDIENLTSTHESNKKHEKRPCNTYKRHSDPHLNGVATYECGVDDTVCLAVALTGDLEDVLYSGTSMAPYSNPLDTRALMRCRGRDGRVWVAVGEQDSHRPEAPTTRKTRHPGPEPTRLASSCLLPASCLPRPTRCVSIIITRLFHGIHPDARCRRRCWPIPEVVEPAIESSSN